jgi:hypothetical protein
MFSRIAVRRGGAFCAAFCLLLIALTGRAVAQNPIHVTYLWHMHQPVYYPYESVNATDTAGRFNFSVRGVHDARTGSYGPWPRAAVQQGADRGLPHAGVQVSFSGSLMENMDGLYGTGWRNDYRWGRNNLRTIRNNPRLDAVGIAYHHSLMPLTTKESMRMQIRLHKEAYRDVWNTGGTYSKGFWPPECAFDVNMIPALVAEGLEWVIVDNGHFDRAAVNYPWAPASSIRPNAADQLNPDPATIGSRWVQLNNVWAPTKVSAPWGYQPHRVQYVDPNSSPSAPDVKRVIAVPAGRYEGNENGRGGYGAFKPENVWGSQISANNNASRPMLLLCHSDGDNFGMLNADAYNGQHGNFLTMVANNPDFEHTSVQDYLEMYPVPANDIIHVEPGSWVGIDGGTPYFDKWRENNARSGEHPDLWSWSVLVAAANRVIHADNLENSYSMNDVRYGIGPDTAKAWHYFLQAETSCHWYWDFDRANPWDGNTTRGANLAIAEANKVINRSPGTDPIGPTIWPPQRDIYNPGGKQYNEATNAPSNFTVFTFVDDVSGLQSVKLKWRRDLDGVNPLLEYDNELYADNTNKLTAWTSIDMTGDFYPPVKGPLVPDPANRAKRFQAMISGQNDALLGYFVEAVDTKGNVSRSDIAHVWVGSGAGGGGGGGGGLPAHVTATQPVAGGPVTIIYTKAGTLLANAPQVFIHIGYNGWQGVIMPNPAMTDAGAAWTYVYQPPAGATLINFVFNNGSGQWDNNTGLDHSLAVTGGAPEIPAAPTGLVATAAAHDRVNVGWNTVPGATSYQVFRGTTLAGTITTGNTLTDTGLSGSTAYSYTVKAVNAAGTSPASNVANVTTPPQPTTPDFSLTGRAPEGYLLTSPGMTIYAAVRGTKLYVATWYAGGAAGNDHFIFVGNALRASADVNALPTWSKVGKMAIAANSPVLCMESANGWAGWQRNDGTGAVAGTVRTTELNGAAGQNVEGVIDLVEVFGSMPATIYIASTAFQTANQGILGAQAPAMLTDNGNLDPTEFLAIPVASIRDTPGDNRLDRLDPVRQFRVVKAQPSLGGLSLSVPTVPGRRYRVQYRPALGSGTWTDTGTVLTGLGQEEQSMPATPPEGAPAGAQGYYRVVAQP